MTILPDSIVVASEECFSFMLPAADLSEVLLWNVVPDDFPDETLRGLSVVEARVTKRSPDNSAVRVMFRHPVNLNSKVWVGGRTAAPAKK